MKERPILFNADMVRAILAGRKTQTRRPVSWPLEFVGGRGDENDPSAWARRYYSGHRMDEEYLTLDLILDRYPHVVPFGQVGDRLWVRETWAPMCKQADPECWCGSEEIEKKPFLDYDGHYIEYRADSGNKRPGDWPDPEEDEFQDAPRWRPSIHMPRWASRITLEITGVRVERLQEISEEDADAEGFSPATGTIGCRDRFWETWQRLYGDWLSNPWVWVIEFERTKEHS